MASHNLKPPASVLPKNLAFQFRIAGHHDRPAIKVVDEVIVIGAKAQRTQGFLGLQLRFFAAELLVGFEFLEVFDDAARTIQPDP